MYSDVRKHNKFTVDARLQIVLPYSNDTNTLGTINFLIKYMHNNNIMAYFLFIYKVLSSLFITLALQNYNAYQTRKIRCLFALT
jgi:hypothetical protein